MYHIFHIEDDPIVADAVKTSLLAETDFQHLWHKNSENALQEIKSSLADVVLLDLHLSDKDEADGLQILKSLRKANQHIPVIVY